MPNFAKKIEGFNNPNVILAGVETKSGEEKTTADIWDCSKKFINGVDATTSDDEKTSQKSTNDEKEE